MGFKILIRAAAKSSLLDMMISSFENYPYSLLAPSESELDWADSDALNAYVCDKHPNIVINFPLDDSPLDGETEVKAVSKLAKLCVNQNIPMIQLSSFRVFGRAGNLDEIGEDLAPAPRDNDGKFMLSVEEACAINRDHIILRLGWMLTGRGDNVLSAMLSKVLKEEPFFVSDHYFGAPIQESFVVKVLIAMIQQILCGAENWGVFHLRASDSCSEAEFCDSVVRLINSELDRTVVMPLVAGVEDDRRLFEGSANLSGDRCTDNFGVQLPSWRKGLRGLVRAELERAGCFSKVVDDNTGR